MPNIKSAKKRLRQNIKRRTRNRSVKSSLKTQMRKVREAAAAKDLPQGESEFRLAVKKLDKAATHGVIHRNTAARLKSRLSARLKTAKVGG
jgi:small subunit ribosomal protein S20